MIKLDHVAYRTSDRWKTAGFFIDAMGYKVQTEFVIKFEDGEEAECIALEQPAEEWVIAPFTTSSLPNDDLPMTFSATISSERQYHGVDQPELFISDGTPNSIVGKWVAERGGVGGLHHIAYRVDSVEETMREWQAKGWATFSSSSPLKCPGLTQVFTEVHPLLGVIIELIERDEGAKGFCAENVRKLMESTANSL